MATTLKHIAEKLNISVAAVSKALNNSSDISEKTKRLVCETAKAMNYTPNAIARGLVTNKTNTIGIIIPDITNPFYPEIELGIEDTVSKKGYNVFLCNSNGKVKREEEYMRLLISKKVDGIIWAPVGGENTELINNIEIPLVTLCIKSGYENENFIGIDDFQGGYIATKHLLANGYKNILYIGDKNNIKSTKERLNGYKKALNEFNIEIKDELIVGGSFTRESGYEITKEIFTNYKDIDGIFAVNDLIALGAMQALRELGFKIPDEVGIVGFDDISFAKLEEISLTSVIQPKYNMGTLAADMILRKIENNDKFCENVTLQPKLAIRSTVRKRAKSEEGRC
ncbi:LacI family DNA-binding transcriptional regulator [Clostridium rectalis]|uniref:LacI family DNA-binding transcriptional regulator n=1 Tax=Clostridium rectalis TaxID=2040295 RepID=UPI000F636E40|nr:LacI family DNA-binding transcriptional regulator [Clostridium rectalis]